MVKLIILGALLFLFAEACGRQSDRVVVQAPAVDAAYAEVLPLVQRDCGGCHGVQAGIPVFDSGAAFTASSALAEIRAGDMPPAPHTISADDKTKLVAYLTR